MAAKVDKAFLLAALKNGLTPAQIAEIVGVTDSAVVQIIQEYGLQAEATRNSKFANIDEKINSIEERVLTQMDKSVKWETDLNKLTRIFQVVNAAKRRSLAEGDTLPGSQDVKLVSINLPSHVELNFHLDNNRRLVGVGDQSLQTMPAGKLVERSKELSHETAKSNKSIIDQL